MKKNRHAYPTQAGCANANIGVDLSKNYGYMFSFDDFGSSGVNDPCADDYRGIFAFSEPETVNIKNFVTTWTNI